MATLSRKDAVADVYYAVYSLLESQDWSETYHHLNVQIVSVQVCASLYRTENSPLRINTPLT